MKSTTRSRLYRVSSWGVLFEAALAIGFAAMVKRVLPFRWFSRILGVPVEQSSTSSIPRELRADLVWAFRNIHRIPLVRPLCLTEVLALSLLLRRRGLRGTSFLGVAQKPPFQAHAWMRCGPDLLPRKQDLEPYRVVGMFEPLAR